MERTPFGALTKYCFDVIIIFYITNIFLDYPIIMKNGNGQQVKDHLTVLIENLRSEGKGQLPPERKLAEMTGSSRGTISKIISQLCGEGVLVRRHGSGTYIMGAVQSTRQISIGVGMRGFGQNDQHFDKLLRGAAAYTDEHAASMQVFDRLPEHFKCLPADNRVALAIDNKLVDGFLIVSRMPLEIIRYMEERLPLVIVNGILNNGELVCVSCDYVEAGYLAAKYLMDRGHSHIVYCFDWINHPEISQNETGIRLAMENGGLQFTQKDRLFTGRNYDYMKKYVCEFLQNKPDTTAIIVRNESYAWRLIYILEELGKKVPDDISIISVGNYKEQWKSSPGMTSVDNRLEEMAGQAAMLLIEMIKGNLPEEKIHLLHPSLVERDSVRAVGK